MIRFNTRISEVPRHRPPQRMRTGFGLILLAALSAAPAGTATALEIVLVDGTLTARRARRAVDGGGGGVGSPLLNGSFSAGLDAWTSSQSGGGANPGLAAVEDGTALLREGDSFLVTLSQGFQVPPEATELSFSVGLDPGFDVIADSLPDAFEVSLLDLDNVPVLASWSDEATSFLNFQESGAVRSGSGVTWDGSRATLDLRGVPAGLSATLYFDLIGADSDTGSAVRIDDVVLAFDTRETFVRGDADLSGGINITDSLFILYFLFVNPTLSRCPDAADTQNDGRVNLTDSVYVLQYLFVGGSPPPPPFPSCGPDEGAEDGLDCEPCACPGAAQGGSCP